MSTKHFFSILLIVSFLSSCSSSKKHEVIAFNPFDNYQVDNDTLALSMDLTKAIMDGITIPSDSASEPYFKIKFKVKNTDKIAKKFFYKVYYQNESYKFREYIKDGRQIFYNPRATENFYGSWNEGNVGFHETKEIPADEQFHEIIDSIRIMGNPRNEAMYFGGFNTKNKISDREMYLMIESIKNNDDWYSKLKIKAKKANISEDEQLYIDAKWSINYDRSKGEENLRWQRNPRAGNYNFMLVVADEEERNTIPEHIKNIEIKDSTENYKNPFYYFVHEPFNKHRGTSIIASSKILKTKVTFQPQKGIYVDPFKQDKEVDDKYFNKKCGMNDDYFSYAQFEQFMHHIDYNYKLKNIPKVYNVVDDNYTQEQYEEDSLYYSDGKLLDDHTKVTEFPGSTIGYDKNNDALFIKNPGQKNNTALRKENVGVNTRIGFTYGKFRAKIKFPKMISEDYVWNGLTCAFWLINMGDGDWNARANCNNGFIQKENNDSKDKIERTAYSEIDIEIVKTSKHWPKTSYGGDSIVPVDNGLNNNVTITATNWDLACTEPSNYNAGIQSVIFDNQEFFTHRWDHWYKALTIKYENPHEETLGEEFYYEIDWRPDRITWRIGKDKDNMKVFGYMDSTITSIPNNQMLAVVTQEFHYTDWWPMSPFKQDFIPFPKDDMVGYIYEIEIE